MPPAIWLTARRVLESCFVTKKDLLLSGDVPPQVAQEKPAARTSVDLKVMYA